MKLILNFKNETSQKRQISKAKFQKLAEMLLKNKIKTDILELNLTLVKASKIRALKEKYLEKKDPWPSILAFPIWQNPLKLKRQKVLYLGEILLCGENARLKSENLDFLFKHGLKHLLGKHH